jgi:ubiquinone/menaquinone biosynthesis C-methylase UbiE
MQQKPAHLAPEYGKQFQDLSMVEAYKHRPLYPDEVFDILDSLITEQPRHVLDIGCGTGAIARFLVSKADRLDAVDFSQNMIAYGKKLSNGDNPHLHWLYGRVEDVTLNPPYTLVTAGASLHWMDWNVVLPRLHDMLVPSGYLAIIEHETFPKAWYDHLAAIIPRYSTNVKYQPYNLIDELEMRGLFQKVGERSTQSIPFTQSIDEYIESFHSRNGFSRERMKPEMAAAFDNEAKKILLKEYPDGIMSLQVVGNVIWGVPKRP